MHSNFVVIPARGGSKGVLKKNLKIIHGKPLVVRSIIHATELVPNENIILSTDSEEIIKVVSEYFGIKRIQCKIDSLTRFGTFNLHYRNKKLSNDNALITDVLFSIYKLLKNQDLNPFTFCLLQPTTPFRSKVELKKIRKILEKNLNSRISLVSVRLVDEQHPARMYKLGVNDILSPLTGFRKSLTFRRQDLPKIFLRDGGYYIIGVSLIKKKLQYNVRPRGFVRSFPWSINIDTENDLLIADSVKKIDVIWDPSFKKI